MNLTGEDLHYKDGCDLMWYKKDDDLYGNDGTGDSCLSSLKEV